MRTAYKVLLQSGNDYLYSKQLDEAQAEYLRALQVDEYGKFARIGLTKVLAKKCELFGVYCEEAQDHLHFIKEMHFLTEGKFMELEKELSIHVQH